MGLLWCLGLTKAAVYLRLANELIKLSSCHSLFRNSDLDAIRYQSNRDTLVTCHLNCFRSAYHNSSQENYYFSCLGMWEKYPSAPPGLPACYREHIVRCWWGEEKDPANVKRRWMPPTNVQVNVTTCESCWLNVKNQPRRMEKVTFGGALKSSVHSNSFT